MAKRYVIVRNRGCKQRRCRKDSVHDFGRKGFPGKQQGSLFHGKSWKPGKGQGIDPEGVLVLAVIEGFGRHSCFQEVVDGTNK